ncbi:hypothetical protein LZC95_39750 [Pendulispora brunnea]|uniref:Uncharacterized protein n=1 Tax=Pendulispora brunnea TaxID=2905690 RepID=A0ABZ2K609_9BACT
MHMELNDDAFRFFTGLSGRLHLALSEEPTRITPNLLNLAAPPTARVTDASITFKVFEDGNFRALTEEEWGRVVMRTPSIRMRDRLGELVVEHLAPDGSVFSVRDLCAAVEETARRSRASSKWFGGVDVHHVYFEGIHLDEDGVWDIRWGS